MTFGPALRRLLLTVHVAASVGWLGAVAAFLSLAVAGLTAADARVAGSTYPAMELVSRHVLVPASLASLASGVAHALGSPWGLLRHWWVVVKLAITALATLLLVVHLQPIGLAARAASSGALPVGDLRLQLVVDASLALVALLVATTLSVYKPRGLTAYGQRRARAARAEAAPVSPRR